MKFIQSTPSDYIARLFPSLEGLPLHVHSVYNRALNLCLPDGGLLAILEPDVGGSPFGITASVPFVVELSHPLVTAYCIRGSIYIGDLVFMTNLGVEYPTSFTPPPYAPAWNARRLLCVIQKNPSYLVQDRQTGFGTLLTVLFEKVPNLHSFRSRHFLIRALPCVSNLITASAPDALEYALGIIGLGVGLTPSGDDFLVGFLAVCDRLWSQDELEYLLNYAASNTTSVSYNYLFHAAQRRFSKSLRRFLELLWQRGNDSDVSDALTSLLNFGSTSGVDTLVGIIIALLRREKENTL